IGHHAFKLPFLLSFAASLGAAVGSRGSLYAVKADEQLTEAQELATLLSINDRVLRHNIRNELSVALGYLTEIEAADDSPETRAQVATIRDHLESLLDTSERTRRLASIWQTDARCSVDLVTVVEEEVAQLTAEAPDATIRTELPERCVVRTHPSVRVAFEEALRNAVEHNDDVTVTVRVWRDDAVHLVVADDGRGFDIDPEAATEYGRSSTPDGTGFGLAIVREIAAAHGWELSVDDRDGARFEFRPES
ncbi:sensor histidine kinase, partial [Halorubrum sp. SD626R]|uniref:sensor histidine kinase n=1 Tax=Halorubrum sp. SD626R TaxID=1419722 RepID=UPI0010F5F395